MFLLVSFEGLKIGRARYLILAPNEFADDALIARVYQNGIMNLATNLHGRGRLAIPDPDFFNQTCKEMADKNWPESVKQRIKNERKPFLVVMTVDFDEFDPRTHDWAIAWLADTPNPKGKMPGLFKAILDTVTKNRDLLDYFRTIAPRSKYGTVTCKGQDAPERMERRPGRPGILNQHWPVRKVLADIKMECGLKTVPEGQRLNIVKEIICRVQVKHDEFNFPPKSILAAITKERLW